MIVSRWPVAAVPIFGDCPNFRGHRAGTDAERWSAVVDENGTVPFSAAIFAGTAGADAECWSAVVDKNGAVPVGLQPPALPQAPGQHRQGGDKLQEPVKVAIGLQMGLVSFGRNDILQDGPGVAIAQPSPLQRAGQTEVPLVVLPRNHTRRPGEKRDQCQHEADHGESPGQLPRPAGHQQQHNGQGPDLDEHRHGQQPAGGPPAPSA